MVGSPAVKGSRTCRLLVVVLRRPKPCVCICKDVNMCKMIRIVNLLLISIITSCFSLYLFVGRVYWVTWIRLFDLPLWTIFSKIVFMNKKTKNIINIIYKWYANVTYAQVHISVYLKKVKKMIVKIKINRWYGLLIIMDRTI